MLLFIDMAKFIRVSRLSSDPTGNPVRTTVGRIEKKTLELPTDLMEALSADEQAEVAEAVELYKQAAAARRKAIALAFPVTARTVMEYLETDADEAQRALITNAIREAVREVRKMAL